MQIRRTTRQIEIALRTAPQGPGVDHELHARRGARSVQTPGDRQCTQTGHPQSILQWSAGGFVELQPRTGVRRIELDLQFVASNAIGAARNNIRCHILQ